jgi:hypothetical protein
MYRATGSSVTVDEVRAYEESLNQQDVDLGISSSTVPIETTTTLTPSQTNDNPQILSFAEIKELIEAGRLDEIPHNKVIPDSLNVRPPFQLLSSLPDELIEFNRKKHQVHQ